TTGLDPRSKLEVQDFIREVRTLHDATILLCTHDMVEAEMLADRVGLLDRGQLLFLEPVDEVKERFGVETLEEAFFAATGRSFEILTETVSWERWEGTIEYTFMAPLSRPVHLFGMGLFAVAYGVVRASLLFAVIAAFFSLHLPDANFAAALILLAIASVSFIG